MPEKAKPHQRALIIGLTVLGCVLMLVFGLRTLHALKRLRSAPPPPPFAAEVSTDVETIEDWMTIPFISHAYRVPPEILFEALQIPPHRNEKKSLKELNEEYYPNEDGYVLAAVKATILAHQTPPAPAPPTVPQP